MPREHPEEIRSFVHARIRKKSAETLRSYFQGYTFLRTRKRPDKKEHMDAALLFRITPFYIFQKNVNQKVKTTTFNPE